MKKIITACAVAGALALGFSTPASAQLREQPKWQDGSAGYHLGCAIGKALGIQMCGELEPGFGSGDSGGGKSAGGAQGSGGGGGGR